MKLGKTKAVISWTYEKQNEGFKIMQQRGCDAPLAGASPQDWTSFCCFISLIHPAVTSGARSSFSLYSRSRAHAAFTSHFLWRNASFLTNKRLVASQLLSSSLVSHARRSPFCPPFVYFTPSIMQGLISQSRFELWHASAKSGEQNFCAGGSFPFTLA